MALPGETIGNLNHKGTKKDTQSSQINMCLKKFPIEDKVNKEFWF